MVVPLSPLIGVAGNRTESGISAVKKYRPQSIRISIITALIKPIIVTSVTNYSTPFYVGSAFEQAICFDILIF